MHKQTKSSTQKKKKNKMEKDEMERRYKVSFMYIEV